jgi:hypothetical protein
VAAAATNEAPCQHASLRPQLPRFRPLVGRERALTLSAKCRREQMQQAACSLVGFGLRGPPAHRISGPACADHCK